MMKLWVVFKCNFAPAPNECCGVFSSREKAIAACHGTDYGFGTAVLDVAFPFGLTEWPGWEWCGIDFPDVTPPVGPIKDGPKEQFI